MDSSPHPTDQTSLDLDPGPTVAAPPATGLAANNIGKAYRGRVVVKDIDGALSRGRIGGIGGCGGEARFPCGEAAEGAFRERYANDERWEMLEAADAYNRRAFDPGLQQALALYFLLRQSTTIGILALGNSNSTNDE